MKSIDGKFELVEEIPDVGIHWNRLAITCSCGFLESSYSALSAEQIRLAETDPIAALKRLPENDRAKLIAFYMIHSDGAGHDCKLALVGDIPEA